MSDWADLRIFVYFVFFNCSHLVNISEFSGKIVHILAIYYIGLRFYQGVGGKNRFI